MKQKVGGLPLFAWLAAAGGLAAVIFIRSRRAAQQSAGSDYGSARVMSGQPQAVFYSGQGTPGGLPSTTDTITPTPTPPPPPGGGAPPPTGGGGGGGGGSLQGPTGGSGGFGLDTGAAPTAAGSTRNLAKVRPSGSSSTSRGINAVRAESPFQTATPVAVPGYSQPANASGNVRIGFGAAVD